MVDPVNEYLAILYCVLILLALAFIYHAFQWAEKKKYTANMVQLFRIVQQKIGYEVNPIEITIFCLYLCKTLKSDLYSSGRNG